MVRLLSDHDHPPNSVYYLGFVINRRLGIIAFLQFIQHLVFELHMLEGGGRQYFCQLGSLLLVGSALLEIYLYD